MKNLFDIVSHFEIQGTISDIKPLGAGLINDTYKVTTAETDAPDYVLQRINHAIFQNVEMLQNNIASVKNEPNIFGIIDVLIPKRSQIL